MVSTGEGHREKHRQIGHIPTYAHLITHQEPQRAKRESASETSAESRARDLLSRPVEG